VVWVTTAGALGRGSRCSFGSVLDGEERRQERGKRMSKLVHDFGGGRVQHVVSIVLKKSCFELEKLLWVGPFGSGFF
jgi:hypothetical protein